MGLPAIDCLREVSSLEHRVYGRPGVSNLVWPVSLFRVFMIVVVVITYVKVPGQIHDEGGRAHAA